jgi:circadian clock protein KaiC
MLIRLVDFLKMHQITAVFTNLTSGDMAREMTDMGISSVMDTWILVRDIELGGERNRGIYVLKSRGSAHSNQIREFVISSAGIDLLDVYVGPEGVLTGSARLTQEARERAERLLQQQETDRKQTELERRRQAMETQIKVLQAQFEEERERIMREISIDRDHEKRVADDRANMLKSRKAESVSNGPAGRKVKQ